MNSTVSNTTTTTPTSLPEMLTSNPPDISIGGHGINYVTVPGLISQSFKPSTSATAYQLGVWPGAISTGEELVIGLYTDGADQYGNPIPYFLIAQTSVITSLSPETWNVENLQTPVNLAAGQRYWLVFGVNVNSEFWYNAGYSPVAWNCPWTFSPTMPTVDCDGSFSAWTSAYFYSGVWTHVQSGPPQAYVFGWHFDVPSKSTVTSITTTFVAPSVQEPAPGICSIDPSKHCMTSFWTGASNENTPNAPIYEFAQGGLLTMYLGPGTLTYQFFSEYYVRNPLTGQTVEVWHSEVNAIGVISGHTITATVSVDPQNSAKWLVSVYDNEVAQIIDQYTFSYPAIMNRLLYVGENSMFKGLPQYILDFGTVTMSGSAIVNGHNQNLYYLYSHFTPMKDEPVNSQGQPYVIVGAITRKNPTFTLIYNTTFY
jgi:hypothetical protein